LFHCIFEKGGIVVATSNRKPDDLYKDGLQRERFLPFIDLIYERMEIEELNAQHDYRLQHLKSLSTMYFTPVGKEADQFIKHSFEELTNGLKPVRQTLQVLGRKLVIDKTYGDIAWCSFKDLCETPLGSADYLEIASEFSTLLLENIPQMNKEKRNEARRFVTLIDALYEHRVKLVCTAEVSPQELYLDGDGSFEFQRTVSRLIEMQSDSYLSKAHLV
jgi:cell division protein ZapE